MSPASPTKKTYLALLQPSQIIDICLAFEPYAPTHVKNSVWPLDITAAISALQRSSSHEHSPTNDQEDQEQAPSTSQPFSPYPYHSPYYSSQQSSYASFTHHYPSNLRNVPNPPQDDLPSYEEMIVEALKDFADPEGVAPKDLFTWMASHYPLQTNFRPSASQALQKAFKRGRLEKNPNGKYRLNPSWEGGNTSRRTTRRPQTQAQSIMVSPGTQHPPPPPPPNVPVPAFTHTPLHHHHHHPSSPHPPNIQPPYSYFPYPYPQAQTSASVPGGVPGLVPFPGGSGSGADEEIAEGSEAWKAAQNILKAISFDGNASERAGAVAVDTLTGPSAASPSASADAAVRLLAATAHGGGGNERMELQVHLALLAAQLMGIAQAKESEETRKEGVGDAVRDDRDNDTDGEEDHHPMRGITTATK